MENHEGAIADARGDALAADIQFGVQAAHGQRAIVRILHLELDQEILLQEVAALHLDPGHGEIRPLELGRAGGAAHQ